MSNDIKSTDFIQSLGKGLSVLALFNAQQPRMTLTEVAQATGLTRANARRILLTLAHLGYVHSNDGRYFAPTPKVLQLGFSYLSSLSFREWARPYMEQLAARVNESCSLSVRDGLELVYVERVQTKRIMSITLGVGMRLPLHATSMGKVLLMDQTDTDLRTLFTDTGLQAFTPRTLTSLNALQAELAVVKQQGWAMSDEELETGIRSIAVPLRNSRGEVLAALNISAHAGRVSREELLSKLLPALQQCASDIESTLKNSQ